MGKPVTSKSQRVRTWWADYGGFLLFAVTLILCSVSILLPAVAAKN